MSLDQPRNSIEDNYLELFLYFYRNNEVIKFGQTVIISIISNITIQKPTFSVSFVVFDVTILQRKIVSHIFFTLKLINQNLLEQRFLKLNVRFTLCYHCIVVIDTC